MTWAPSPRRHDAAVAAAHGDDAIWVAVSHGDVIKALLADALGMHLDAFQRIVVDPCSLAVVRYGSTGAQVERVNDTAGSVDGILPGSRRTGRRGAARRAAR